MQWGPREAITLSGGGLRQGGKAKKTFVSGKIMFLLALVPQASKTNTWPTKHFGIPFLTVLNLIFKISLCPGGPGGGSGLSFS